MRTSRICLIAAVFVAVGTLAPPAYGQEGDRAERIRTLIEVSGAARLMDAIMPLMMAQMMDLIRTLRPEIPDQLLEDVEAEMEAQFRDSVPLFLELTVPVYERHFTAEEIEALVAFYQSDVGRKIVEKGPALAEEGQKIGRLWGEIAGERAYERAAARLREEGYEL